MRTDLILISRAAAALNLKKRYYTAIPCTNGHDCARYTSTGQCVSCMKKNARKYYHRSKGFLTTITYHCHPDDVDQVKQFLDAVHENRNLRGSPIPYGKAPPKPLTLEEIAERVRGAQHVSKEDNNRLRRHMGHRELT